MTIHPHFPNPSPAELPPPEALAPAVRADGWTPERQRRFLESIAEGHTVEDACRIVGMSVNSAYVLRRRAAGQAFALGWRAANLIARDRVADTLLVRAIEGQEETTIRGDVTIVRRRFDNRLATNMLARFDREADELDHPEARAARMIVGEFDAYLAAIARDDGPARAARFLRLRARIEGEVEFAPADALERADRFARHGGGLAREVEIGDLDPTECDRWTAEQWRRAHAAGLLVLGALNPKTATVEIGIDETLEEECARSPHLPNLAPGEGVLIEQLGRVWWDERDEDWATDFPLPPGASAYDCNVSGPYGARDYKRDLTEEERDAIAHWPRGHVPDVEERRDLDCRAAFFAHAADVPGLEPLFVKARAIVAGAGRDYPLLASAVAARSAAPPARRAVH